MKYKVFASQLEAHVGQSPVRGSKAIKTDRNTSKNLNQFLSRVKTLFSRKTQHEVKTADSPMQKPLVLDQRLKTALAEVESYLTEHFSTTPSAFKYQEYSNGISLTSDDPTFSTAVVILTQTGDMLNLPDNVLLLGYVKTDKGDDYLIEHLGNFIKFLKQIGIQHLALAFSKEHYDHPNDVTTAVTTADITCIHLY